MQVSFSLDGGDFLRHLSENLNERRMAEAAAGAVNEAVLVGEQLISEASPVGDYDTPDGRRRGGGFRNSIAHELASADDPVPAGRIFSTAGYAPDVEFGTGIYSEAPNAPRQPITIRAKNPRTVTYIRNGRTVSFTVTMLVWWGPLPTGGSGWHAAREVTIQGMRPRAPFRSNLPAIQERLNEALRRRVAEAMRGE